MDVSYGSKLIFAANAVDAGGTIAGVRFYVNGTQIANDTAAPFYTTHQLDSLGTVVVTGKQPRAELSVDGKRVLVAPGTVSIRVLPGRHVVIATRGTLSSEPVALDVRPGDTLDAAPLLYVTETAWRWSRWKPWAVIGTGAAVAIAGVPMLVHSRSEYDRYQAQFNIQCRAGCPSEPAGLVAIKDNAQTWRYTAIGAFVGGGVLAGLGLAWLALNHPVDTRRVAPDVTTTIVPWRGGTGLTVARTW